MLLTVVETNIHFFLDPYNTIEEAHVLLNIVMRFMFVRLAILAQGCLYVLVYVLYMLCRLILKRFAVYYCKLNENRKNIVNRLLSSVNTVSNPSEIQ